MADLPFHLIIKQSLFLMKKLLIQMLPPGAPDNHQKAPEVSNSGFVAPRPVSDILSRAPSVHSISGLSQASSSHTLNREPLGHTRPGTPIAQQRPLLPQGKKRELREF